MSDLNAPRKYKGLINGKDWETGTLKVYPDDLVAVCRDGKDFYVFKDSVSRFTGYVNSSGEEIFEGDILSLEPLTANDIAVIIWDNACQEWKATGAPFQDPDAGIPLNECLDGLVVGHVFTHQHKLQSVKADLHNEETR